jgi:hypothetical protein
MNEICGVCSSQQIVRCSLPTNMQLQITVKNIQERESISLLRFEIVQ